MSDHVQFVDRVLAHLPASRPTRFEFVHWSHAGRPTDEGFGIMAIPGVDPKKITDAVMDVDHYVGNLDHVAICRSIVDARFAPPDHVRFLQKVDIPVIGAVQHELVLHRVAARSGFEIVAWDLLRPETLALDPKVAFRSDYNVGAWLAAPGVLGYALASAPKRDDVGFLKWKALTTGADVAAARVLKGNLEGMARWAARR